MLTFFREGGFPMFVILGLGLVTLSLAMRASSKPTDARLELVRHLAHATLYSTGVGFAADLAAVFHNAPKYAESLAQLPLIVSQGVAESMGPPILGCTFLSLIAVFSGLGARRLAS